MHWIYNKLRLRENTRERASGQTNERSLVNQQKLNDHMTWVWYALF